MTESSEPPKGKTIIGNMAHSIISMGLPVAIQIVTVPIYLHMLGEGRYGVLSLVWLLFGYFGLFDFGLSRATARRLSQLRSADDQARETVYYTSMLLNVGLGIVVSILFISVSATIFSSFVSNESAFLTELKAAIPYLSLLFPFAFVGNVFVGRLESEERFVVLNNIQIFGSILLQTLPIGVVYIAGASITHAVIGVIIGRLVSIFMFFIAVRARSNTKIRMSFSRVEAKAMLGYGVWIAVSNGVGPILVSIDQFVIGYMLGEKAVAYYSVPYNIAMRALIIPGAVSRVLFPKLARFMDQSSVQLSEDAVKYLAWIMLAACAIGILLIGDTMDVWINPEFSNNSAPVARVLLLGVWINSLAYIPFTLLQSQGRSDLVAKFHVVELIPFVVILILFVRFYGLQGAAIAWSLRVTADAILLFIASGFGMKVFWKLALPGGILILIWLGFEILRPSPIICLCFAGLIAIVGAATGFRKYKSV